MRPKISRNYQIHGGLLDAEATLDTGLTSDIIKGEETVRGSRSIGGTPTRRIVTFLVDLRGTVI